MNMKRNAFIALIAAILLSGCPVLNTGKHPGKSGDGGAYTVSFSVNGGKGATPAPQEVDAGSAITLPDGEGLSKNGYAFGGWNTKADGSGNPYDAGSSFTPNVSITLYARWVPGYTVSFSRNGDGTGMYEALTMTVIAGSSLTLPGVSREDFDLSGWNTKADGSGTNYDGGAEYTPTGTIMLYAMWTAHSTITEGDFIFKGAVTLSIIGYTGIGGNVTIPSMAGGKPVTAIANGDSYSNGVFSEKNLTGVTIPNSIITIGDYAFSHNAITNVVIPDSVTTIGNNAFSSTGLSGSITIPDSVITIGDGAFSYGGIKSVVIGNGVTTIGDGAFMSQNLSGGVIIGTGVTSIGNEAFKNNSLVGEITIPASVTSIGNEAFMNSILESVVIRCVGAAMGGGTFTDTLAKITIESDIDSSLLLDKWIYGYASFRSVYTGAGTYIKTYAGDYDTTTWAKAGGQTLYTVAFDRNDGSSATAIPYLTAYANAGSSVTLPGFTEGRTEYDFGGWNTKADGTGTRYDPGAEYTPTADSTLYVMWLAYADITEGDFTFRGGALTYTVTGYSGSGGAITIPSAANNGKPVVAIADSTSGNGVFQNKNLTGVSIPGGITRIGDFAFRSNQLTSVSIPDSVIRIGTRAFADNQLTSAAIPDSVTSIGNYAFADNQLSSIVIGSSVTSIGAGAFQNNRLTSVTIPDSVTSIWISAFENNRLTSVTIPDSVTLIGDYAFRGNQLTSVTLGSGITSLRGYIFTDATLLSITIGANVMLGTDGYKTFSGCDFDDAYNGGGKQAGTYTRPNTDSEVWTKQ